MNLTVLDPKKVAEVMVKNFGFNPSIDNMENDRENYSYALLDALCKLYNLESMIDKALYKIQEKRNENNS